MKQTRSFKKCTLDYLHDQNLYLAEFILKPWNGWKLARMHSSNAKTQRSWSSSY